MSTTSTTPPQYETDERVTYTTKRPKPLTPEQERALYAYAVEAQDKLRLEVTWPGGRMQLRLVSNDDKRTV